jgi:hypothetical protein
MLLLAISQELQKRTLIQRAVWPHAVEIAFPAREPFIVIAAARRMLLNFRNCCPDHSRLLH